MEDDRLVGFFDKFDSKVRKIELEHRKKIAS